MAVTNNVMDESIILHCVVCVIRGACSCLVDAPPIELLHALSMPYAFVIHIYIFTTLTNIMTMPSKRLDAIQIFVWVFYDESLYSLSIRPLSK